MPPRKRPPEQIIESRHFDSPEEIGRAIKKLERRTSELDALDVKAAILEDSGEDDVIRSNISETIREIFGNNSPEFREHQHIQIWAGPMGMNMPRHTIVESTERGKKQVQVILRGLIARLQEKSEELQDGSSPQPQAYFRELNLHGRIADVANQLYEDGHYFEAVFAASKALINFVKEKSGRYDLDGAPLMREVFSRKNPVLRFNELKDQTDQDEQEGMMHLFEGAVLAIRNPGGHSFPEGSAQRALEYIELLSLLAYRVQESKRV
ncbi:MAG: TIGR02391 family protein [Gemmatimonadota bacterium]|nr:TIGR02391 family protein [Gemmatimonadota bacterium]